MLNIFKAIRLANAKIEAIQETLNDTRDEVTENGSDISELQLKLAMLENTINTMKTEEYQQENLKKLMERAETALKESDVPYVRLVSDQYDPKEGFKIELEWNKAFIAELRKAGYTGATEEDLVQGWLHVVTTSTGQQFI